MRWLVGIGLVDCTASGSPRMSLAMAVDQVDVEALELAGGRVAVAPAVAVLVDADDQLAALRSLIRSDRRAAVAPDGPQARPPGPCRRRRPRPYRRVGDGPAAPAPPAAGRRRAVVQRQQHGDGRGEGAGDRHHPDAAPAAPTPPLAPSRRPRPCVHPASPPLTGTPTACGRCPAPRPPRPAPPARAAPGRQPGQRAAPVVRRLLELALLVGERLRQVVVDPVEALPVVGRCLLSLPPITLSSGRAVVARRRRCSRAAVVAASPRLSCRSIAALHRASRPAASSASVEACASSSPSALAGPCRRSVGHPRCVVGSSS